MSVLIVSNRAVLILDLGPSSGLRVTGLGASVSRSDADYSLDSICRSLADSLHVCREPKSQLL